MEEKLMMSNVLTNLKSLCGLLMNATIESPNNWESLKTTLNNYIELQNEVYKAMTNEGWYQIENVDASKIEQLKQKLNA